MNKPTVWAFGDSFSEEVTSIPKENARWDYVNEFLNGVPYKTWIQLLSEKLKYNYKNRAANGGHFFEKLGGGNSNDHMFLNVCESSSDFKKGDLVFIGFTHPGRFQTYIEETKSIRSVHINQEYGNLDDVEFYNKIYHIRTSPYYVNEILQRFKLLETLSNVVGFKIFYWDWTDMFLELEPELDKSNWIFPRMDGKYSTFNKFFKENLVGENTIYLETDKKIIDHHWGKKTNELLSDEFYNQIKQSI